MFLHDGRPLGGDVCWAAFPWPVPEPCHEERILSALRAVIEPARKDRSDAGTLVRCAVGNDHRGTIYPAAVAMTDVLLVIAGAYPGEPRRVALSVLEDWWGAYEPEDGLESFVNAEGRRIAVIPAIVRRMTRSTPSIRQIAADASDPVAAAIARNLLIVIPLGWGNAVDDGVVQHWGGSVADDGSVRFPDTPR